MLLNLPLVAQAPTLEERLHALLIPKSFGEPSPAVFEILFAVLLSFGLCALVGRTYRYVCGPDRYSQDYVHTLVILGTVVTLTIMVVSGNAAAAFGMFAAFSIIRFRRTVRQSRDIAFVFLAMGAGLAVGARQYVLALVTVPAVCGLALLLTKANLFAAAPAPLRLRVRVGADQDPGALLAPAFAAHLTRHELRSLENVQAGLQLEASYDVMLRDPAGASAFLSAVREATGNNRVVLRSGDVETAD